MIIIGSDHGGYNLKENIKIYLQSKNIDVFDIGCFNNDSCDYPDIALKVANEIVNNNYKKGILVCGTGIGMSITANKVKGIRAAVCSDIFSAKYTVLHNNSNILCLGERVVGFGLACELVNTFLNTKYTFEDRHQIRLNKIAKIEINKQNGEI